MQREELGEFLYSDAWERINPEMQYLLLLMTRISEVHDQASLNLCCDEVGLTTIEANDALEESKGIARIDTYGKSIQIVFSGQFMDFTKNRQIKLDEVNVPEQKTVDKISRKYSQFLKNTTTQVADRIQRAFRHPYAKAAYTAYIEERYTECEELYKQALTEDPDNAWLHNRYAYLLMTKFSKYNEAYGASKTAIRLCKDDPDIWFNHGMIERKLGRMNDAFTSISKAESLGKPSHLCHLQKCFAALSASPIQLPIAKAELRRAEEGRPSNDPYWNKVEDEIIYARQWLARATLRERPR
jgi:tetratricopeptide (TPR) repeat protein